MPLIEGLISLSVRWMQPIQQQGRRTPSASSVTVRSTWFCLVSGFFVLIVQQIHSLRARGVSPSQRSSAVSFATSASCKSFGTSCTTPVATIFLFILVIVRNMGFCINTFLMLLVGHYFDFIRQKRYSTINDSTRAYFKFCVFGIVIKYR